jgi:hypothetical protein
MSWLFGILGLSVIAVLWFVAGLAGQAARREALEQELEEWEGVLDVKRETRDRLASDPDYVKRVQDEYND